MKKIWHKESTDSESPLAKRVEQFTVGNDYILDQILVPYDIRGSKVHAKGLEKIGIISAEELKVLCSELDGIYALWKKGEFVVEQSQEDCHTAIEQYLTRKLGDIGRKIHTGRSRNDQVLVAMRMYERDQIDNVFTLATELGTEFIKFAKQFEFIPMPGYTHTQVAMLSSVGMWSGSLAEMLIMNLEMLRAVRNNVNKCPLGTAAGFGVDLDLPREFIAKELGFASPMIVSLTTQNTRGKIESDILSAITSMSETIAHFANDLVFYSMNELDFFSIDNALCSGSSIMPHKVNVDTCELLRAKHAELLGIYFASRNLSHNLISGYHRDLQLSKKLVMQGFDLIIEMLQMSALVIKNISPNQHKLEAKLRPELFSVHAANQLVKNGMPFREAYAKVGNNLDLIKHVSIDSMLRESKHLGGTGNLGLEFLEEKLRKM